MAGFLSAYSGTRKVVVGDPERGYWVEIQDVLTQGDKEKAERALTSGKIVPGQSAEMTMDTVGYRQLMLLASILDWNLDDDGVIWPINLRSVKRLPGPVFDQLWKVVDELNSPDSTEERRQFPDEGVGGDPDEDVVIRPALARDVPAGAGDVEASWATT